MVALDNEMMHMNQNFLLYVFFWRQVSAAIKGFFNNSSLDFFFHHKIIECIIFLILFYHKKNISYFAC